MLPPRPRRAQIVRDRNVIKPAPGKRQCNCKNKVVTQQVGPGMFQQYTQRVCEECDNVKYVRESEALTVSVEPGMEDGQQIMFFEEGEPLVDGEAGDLMVWLRTLPHPHFERRGMHLLANATISLVEALVGFELEVRGGGWGGWGGECVCARATRKGLGVASTPPAHAAADPDVPLPPRLSCHPPRARLSTWMGTRWRSGARA